MKQLIRLFLIVYSLSLFVSCEEQDFSYDGPLRVEFSANSNSQYYNSRFYYHNFNVAPTIGENTLQVQLIGPHQSENLTVNYKVVSEVYFIIATNRVVLDRPTTGTEGADYRVFRATAILGADYELADGTTTIPAGSSFGNITMNIKVNNNTSKRFFVVLYDSDGLIANNQSKIMMVILGKLNSSNPSI